MRLVANWRAVLKHAASVQLIVLAALLSGVEAALPSAVVAARLIYVSDGTSNKRLAVSDGTNWKLMMSGT